jgi:superfamily II DNA/RNA helicase
VDVVVASPGRLMQHVEQKNVFLSHVNTIVIDEVSGGYDSVLYVLCICC